jgi:hypothetical protein
VIEFVFSFVAQWSARVAIARAFEDNDGGNLGRDGQTA